MFPRLGKALLQHLEGPNGRYTVYAIMYPTTAYIMASIMFPTPKKLTFDLTTHPVSAEEAQELYKKLGSRKWHISSNIEDKCKKKCRRDVKPCSILLRLEKMNGGIKRWGEGVEGRGASRGALENGLRVLEDCDDRRSRACCEIKRRCDDMCRAGLKTCRVLDELEEMHEREAGAGWI